MDCCLGSVISTRSKCGLSVCFLLEHPLMVEGIGSSLVLVVDSLGLQAIELEVLEVSKAEECSPLSPISSCLSI